MDEEKETYRPIMIDGLGVISVKDHGFTLTHENGITDFSYKDYLGGLYHTREEMVEEDVKASKWSHYEALVTDKIVETLCTLEEGLHNLVENTVYHYYFNDQELVDESEETFDREKAIKEAEKSIQPEDIIEINRRTSYDLLETDPDEVIDFCQSRMSKCA